jgi:hypothetical protein
MGEVTMEEALTYLSAERGAALAIPVFGSEIASQSCGAGSSNPVIDGLNFGN